MTNYDELVQRCTDYLTGGGLFNPELANHQAVSELVRDCRDKLSELQAQKPVAWIETGSVYAGEYQDADVFLDEEQIDRQINDHLNGDLKRVPLYAEPVPAVDLAGQELENFVCAGRFDRSIFADDTAFADWIISRARHTLDKLGGK